MAKDTKPEAPTPLGEIEQGPGKMEQFLEGNQKKLLLLLVLGIVGAASWIIFKGLRHANQVRAGDALVAAENISDLQAVMEQFEGTPAAGTATLHLAREQWLDGLRDESIETLRAFLQANPKHAARPSARMALASRLIESDRIEEGSSILKEIGSDPDGAYLAPFAYLRLGDLAASAGDQEAAKSYYQSARDAVSTDAPMVAAVRRLAESRLGLVGVSQPALVAQPLPPTPPPGTRNELPSFVRPPLLPLDAPDNVPPGAETPGDDDQSPTTQPADANPADGDDADGAQPEDQPDPTQPGSDAAPVDPTPDQEPADPPSEPSEPGGDSTSENGESPS